MKVSPALLLSFLLLPVVHSFSFSSPPSALSFCKCACFGNATILPLYIPKDPVHPCLTCTRQWCLEQKLPSCVGAKSPEDDPDVGTGHEGDVEARCFQRDSPKSHVLVVFFVVVVSILLVGAGLKEAGVDYQKVWREQGLRGVISETAELGRRIFQTRSRTPQRYGAMPS